MAIGDAYITEDELSAYLGVTDNDDATLMTAACVAASQTVEQFCQRQFNKTTTAGARQFEARTPWKVDVDDFHTVTDLVVATDESDSGSWDTTWSSTDYTLVPAGGVELGVTGFPFRQIRAVEARRWPCSTGRFRVQVTAQWGWNAVPGSVTEATKMIAARIFNTKSAPLGVASFTEGIVLRVKEDVPQAAMLLRRYQHPGRTGVLVG
jgi:hypothetical protein